jgi:hypothetical protein
VSRYEALLVRAALAYLVLAGVLGVLFYLAPAASVYFRVTHVHLGVIGFFLSFVMGVAYWLMPRPGGVRQEGLEAATFYLLNGGLVLRIVAEPAWRYTGDGSLFVLVVLGGLLQLGAMLVFAFAMHGRVKTADAIRRLRSTRSASPTARG